ncbi:MAG: ABC transporter permease [Bacteroidetes bacterium]|nr:MAG: ABC transporter permease [Bacteroidota bacterium]
MNKIWLVIQREYIIRVRNKTFLLTTFLTPLLFAALFVIPILLMVSSVSNKTIEVVDENNLFQQKFKGKNEFVGKKNKMSGEEIIFQKSKYTNIEEARNAFKESKKYALLHIPKLDIEKPKGVKIYAEKGLSVEVESQITQIVETTIEEAKIVKFGIDKQMLDKVKTDLDVETLKTTGEQNNSALLYGVGFGGGIIIYMAVFIYGAIVMRGVVEEKSSKIIEVIISSVRPFQLMMGKILGIALVGLTQFALWIILTLVIVTGITSFLGADKMAEQQVKQNTEMLNEKQAQEVDKKTKKALSGINNITQDLPITKILVAFVLYFIGGYLMYSALFAAVASAVDTEVEAQQFTTPISMPLIISFVMGQFILREPDGAIAFWLSIFPLTSPVVMMMRLPFDVPLWQLTLSISCLFLGFVGAVWLAGRIYRVGILTHGEKITYKKLYQWLFLKI